MSEGDNEDVHFSDTVKGSDWGCDQEVARMFVTTAPKAIRELAAWGVPWSRIRKGNHEAVINTKKQLFLKMIINMDLLLQETLVELKNGEPVILLMQQDIQCFLQLQMKL